MPPTASPLEFAWTCIAAVGLVGALAVAGEAAGDWLDMRRRPHKHPVERRRLALVAQTVLRNRLSAAFVQLVFVLIGLRAMTLPPNPAASDLGTQLTGLLFLLGSLLMSGTAVLDYIDRLRYKRLDARAATVSAPPVPTWRARRDQVRQEAQKKEQP